MLFAVVEQAVLFVVVVEQAAAWNGNAGKGVRVKWDTGDTNVYRWGYLGNYDVQVLRVPPASAL